MQKFSCRVEQLKYIKVVIGKNTFTSRQNTLIFLISLFKKQKATCNVKLEKLNKL